MKKLSEHQYEVAREKNHTELKDFDLSALLRIADKNWYEMQQKWFLKHSVRTTIKEMFAVRNRWAHFSTDIPKTDTVIKDLEIVIDFLSLFNAEKPVLSDAKQTLHLIKSGGMSDAAMPQVSENGEPDKTVSPSRITTNTMVHLKSDPNTKGIVTNIREVGAAKQFDVFVDGKIKTYFADQIEAEDLTPSSRLTDISDIIRILTAYQIRKPSSESLYSLNAARVDFVPYQFRPALKIIKSHTPRLLIADSVGVGKTIEAGLILKEMQARMPLDSVLIICPKPLVAERKWETEMKRFDENFTSADGSVLRNIIKDAERDGVWPEKHKRLILPYSLLTEDLLEGQQQKRKRFVGLKNLYPAPYFNLVIVDEAHHIRNRDTQKYKAVKFFCEHADAAVFMTATPIQLGNEDLFTLLNLLFPDEVIDKISFKAMSEPNPYINSALRHLRLPHQESDALLALNSAASTEWGQSTIANSSLYPQIKTQLSGGTLSREQRVKMINDVESLHSFSHMINRTRRQDIEDFCLRRAYTLESNFTEHQRTLHNSLLEFEATILKMLHSSVPIKFLMSTISRQAASCIFGLAPTLQALTERRLSQVLEVDYDDEVDLDPIEVKDFLPLVEKIIDLAQNLPAEDPKFDSLSDILKDKQKLDNNKVIIFSTFRHTLNYLKNRIDQLEPRVRVEQINGSVRDEERYHLRERFELPKDNPHALDVLLFTEVGSEGLDYQFCDTVVNYDLPWNPMRIEQRIGRIDRRGQKSELVHIYNCITRGTIDAEIYDRCLCRIGVFEQSIGECEDILGEIVDSSIQKIVFDTTLTDSERTKKFEQLADNEVRRMQEMQRLENDQKHMFGLDISSFTEDIVQAENPWIAPTALKNLVLGYLRDRLDSEKKYINDKRLTLTFAEKEELCKDFGVIKGKCKNSWEAFLCSNQTSCKIVFEQDEAKDPSTFFITPLHPLVRQAATHITGGEEMRTALKVSSTDIAAGEYPFLLFAWEYTGSRPRVELVAVCADEAAQAELPTIIKSAVPIEAEFDKITQDWRKLEETHYKIWLKKRDNFREDARSLCRFKLESLTRSVNARIKIAEQQIAQTTDRKIVKMRTSEIERLKADYATKKSKLEKDAEISDIHITKLVSGMLVVEDDNE